MPKDLDDLGKKEWRRLGAWLHETGRLTPSTLPLLKAYCIANSRAEAMQADLEANGVLIKAPSGYQQKAVTLSVYEKCDKTRFDLLKYFNDLPAKEKVAVDPLTELINRKKAAKK